MEAREEGGPYKSLEDFCRRVDFRALNSLAMESLIKVGALDAFGQRGGLVEASERIVALGQRQTRLRESGQTSMFDLFGQNSPVPMPEIEIPDTDDVSDRERTKWEKEMLGVEVTESNFTREMYAKADQFVVFASELSADKAGQTVNALGQVADVRSRTTRQGKQFLAMSLQLLDGGVELVVWPNVLETTSSLWREGTYLTVQGEVREWDGRVSISVEEAREYFPDGTDEPDRSRGIAEPVAKYDSAPQFDTPAPAAATNGANGAAESAPGIRRRRDAPRRSRCYASAEQTFRPRAHGRSRRLHPDHRKRPIRRRPRHAGRHREGSCSTTRAKRKYSLKSPPTATSSSSKCPSQKSNHAVNSATNWPNSSAPKTSPSPPSPTPRDRALPSYRTPIRYPRTPLDSPGKPGSYR